MISPFRIEYRGRNNVDFDTIVDVSFDSDNGEVDSYLDKDVIASPSWDGSKQNIYGYKYNQQLVATINIFKNDFGDFDATENRRILAWLSSSNKTEKLFIYHDDTEVISYVLVGSFTSIKQNKMSNGRIVGYAAEFTSSSPYAYSDTRVKDIVVNNFAEFSLQCKSDEENKPIYPKYTIIIGDNFYIDVNTDPMHDSFDMMPYTVYRWNNGYYFMDNGQKHVITARFSAGTYIENQTSDNSTKGKYYLCLNDMNIYQGIQNDDESYGWEKISKVGDSVRIITNNAQLGAISSEITGCYSNEVINLDGTNRLISSSRTPMRIFGNDFNWKFPYLMNGNNVITVTGNCTIHMEWTEPRKVGQL